MKIFIGNEVEGPDRDELTLFIPKNATNRKDFLKIADENKISRLYFGAGNDRGIAEDVIPLLHSIPPHFTCILEIVNIVQVSSIPKEFLDRTQIVFVIFRDVWSSVDTIKIETPLHIYWCDIKNSIVSGIDDPLYKKDKEI